MGASDSVVHGRLDETPCLFTTELLSIVLNIDFPHLFQGECRFFSKDKRGLTFAKSSGSDTGVDL